MLVPQQRVKVNLARLTIEGVAFSENVREVPAVILRQTAADPPTYLVELMFSFKGIRRVELPADRITPA